MELLNRLTIKNLKLNKKRTIVTIIGIILSTALITGVATLVSSFQKSIVEYEKRQAGNYHYQFINVPKEELKYIENNRNIEKTYITQNIGYSRLEETKNEYKPYLYLIGFSQEAIENLKLNLLEGRFPKNENEIVISKHIQTNGKVDLRIGDEITLDIGRRMSDENELNQSNPYNAPKYTRDDIEKNLTEEEIKKKLAERVEEELVEEFTKTYKIVGIIERPSMEIESYSAPGYTIITLLNNYVDGKNLNVYTRYKDLDKAKETTSQILGISENELDILTMEEYNDLKYKIDKNTSLIRWENLEFNNGTLKMLYSVASLVIMIIIITSVFCIRNSFEISITEKIKQYGMLASIGATSKQIRKNVLYEALILAVIGIPIGILSGLGAIFILLKVITSILGEGLLDMQLIFATNIMSIIIAIVLSGVTIYLSARKSARKASKISPIEAIRSNQHIKIKSKKLRSPKLIKKIFGIGGDIAYKNLKRNNKKYRTTVISIVVSVSIFIAMSSFMGYAFKASTIYYKDYKYNIVLSTLNDSVDFQEISQNPEIKSYSLIRDLPVSSKDMPNHYSNDYKSMYEDSTEDLVEISFLIESVGRDEYERYIKELNLKYDDVKDKGILLDEQMEYVEINGESSYRMFRTYDYKKGDTINLTTDKQNREINIEIAATTSKRPKGLENNYFMTGIMIVSDEFIDKYLEDINDKINMFIDAKNPGNLQQYVKKEYATNIDVYNVDEEVRQQKSMWIVIAIFLYGFITVISLIGVTNIFNTITTNMELRQKEFANLKSIGMTKKEFNRMIRLESIFYGFKSLIIGIPIGIFLSYMMYKAFAENADMGYILPKNGILIAIVAVIILINGIMRYSLNKINKQNIIETIRKNNI